MLHEVIEGDNGAVPPTIADLARKLRWSESKALRTADRLIEAGLLLDERAGRSRLVRANHSSPLYPLALQALFLHYGTEPPQPGRANPEGGSDPRYSVSLSDSVRPYVPDQLWPGNVTQPGSSSSDDLYDGPSLVEARAHVLRIDEATRPTALLNSTLHEAWDRWRYERDRDLVHRASRLGPGARTARNVLIHSAYTAQRAGHTRVGQRHWALAVFALHAEVQLLRTCLLDWCATGMRLMDQRTDQNTRLVAALSALDDSDQVDRGHLASDSDRAALLVRVRECRTDLAHTDHELESYYTGVGRRDDIGRAGERLIVTGLERVTGNLEQQVIEMAAHPAFETWTEHLAAARPAPHV